MESDLQEAFDRVDLRYKGSEEGLLKTGFKGLDRLLGGFGPGELVTIASRPAVGKTSFALNLILHMSVQQKVKVALFSFGLDKDKIVDRLLALESEIDYWRLRTGRFSGDDLDSLSKAMGTLTNAPILIDGDRSNTFFQLIEKFKQVEKPVGALFVDGIQQIEHPESKYQNRYEEVAYMVRELSRLAQEEKIPVFVVSQLSRAPEYRTGANKLVLSDLSESGQLERDSEVVLMLECEGDGCKEDVTVSTTVSIKKNSNGRAGSVSMLFDRRSLRFFEPDYSND